MAESSARRHYYFKTRIAQKRAAIYQNEGDIRSQHVFFKSIAKRSFVFLVLL